MKSFKHILYVSFLLLSLAVWSNHCMLSEAFASSSSNKSGCHDKSNSKDSKNHHSRSDCSKRGCCQPWLESSVDPLLNSTIVVTTKPLIFSFTFALLNYNQFNLKTFSFVSSADPPMLVYKLLSTLSLAPNAPPTFLV